MKNNLVNIRRLLSFFIIALFISGLTAIPVDPQLSFLLRYVPPTSDVHHWLQKVLSAYRQVNNDHAFLLYGYDWLAFAHFVLAILFLGPYRDPVKNIWVIEFGLIACVLVLPLAFIAGTSRHIPWGWILIDCSFGVFGFIPLYIALQWTKKLSSYKQQQTIINI